MGLLGLFFAMAIFRLILFCITIFAVPPGLWLFPNLFEDVGFVDSFKPLWGWQEVSCRDILASKDVCVLTLGLPDEETEEDTEEGQEGRPCYRRQRDQISCP